MNKKDIDNNLTCAKCKKSFSSVKYLRGHYCTGKVVDKMPPYVPVSK